MAVRFSDKDIEAFMSERKALAEDWRKRTNTVAKLGHREGHLNIRGDDGTEFRVIFRENLTNRHDFTVILGVRDPGSGQIFRVRRYNGRSHEHTNHIEGETFYDYHIHRATERYQDLGAREDAFAERTDRYDSLESAMRCLFADAAFAVPADLFGDGIDVC